VAIMNKKAISIKESACSLSISISTMKRLIYNRDIASYKIGGRRVVDVASLDKFLADRLEAGK
jgi:excisionase family DNA binding protein